MWWTLGSKDEATVTGMELSGESRRNKARGCVDVCAGRWGGVKRNGLEWTLLAFRLLGCPSVPLSW